MVVSVIGGVDYGQLSFGGTINADTATIAFPIIIPRIGLRYYLSSKQLTPYFYGTIGGIGTTKTEESTEVKFTGRIIWWSLGIGADYALSDALSLCGQYGLNSTKITGEFERQDALVSGEVGYRQTVASLGMKFKF